MNVFDHKDLRNHLLQLCPKIVKHPVYLNIYTGWLAKSLPSGQILRCSQEGCAYVERSEVLPVISDSRLLIRILDVRHPMDIYIYMYIVRGVYTYMVRTACVYWFLYPVLTRGAELLAVVLELLVHSGRIHLAARAISYSCFQYLACVYKCGCILT